MPGIMAWTGVAMGVGIVLVVLGALGVAAGAGIALVGPDAVSDARDDGGDGGVLGLRQDDGRAGDDEARQARQEARLAGAAVAASGAAFILVGGILIAIARGVESSRRSDGNRPGTPL